MRILTASGLVGLGLVVGLGLPLLVPTAHAEQQTPGQPQAKIQVRWREFVNGPGRPFHITAITRFGQGGCWFVLGDGGGELLSISEAPANACNP